MTWIYTGLVALSMAGAVISGSGRALGAGMLEGAGAGITLALSLAGPICLWSGVGRLMDSLGLTDRLAGFLSPLLRRIFPDIRRDPVLARELSANFCANLLGLGNAATPRGIRAMQRLGPRGVATDQVCRLVVLNTASIQLIPSTVAAIRSGLGSARPFDILPAVWLTSLLSAGAGLGMAWILGKLWTDA